MPVVLAAAGPFGLAIGSFLNVVIYRLPAKLSLSRPPSACPHCDHVIRSRHNVPVFAWLVLRGKCADCRGPISVRYPLVELVTALLFVASAWKLGHDSLLPALPAFWYFAAIGIALSLIDFDHHRLPNSIVLTAYPVLAVLLGAAALISGAPEALLRAVIGGAALYAFYFVIHIVQPRGMGFGDVKLAAVVGAVLAYLSYSTLIVGAFAAFFFGGLVGAAMMLAGRGSRKSAIPFGPFMITGALFAVFFGATLSSVYTNALVA